MSVQWRGSKEGAPRKASIPKREPSQAGKPSTSITERKLLHKGRHVTAWTVNHEGDVFVELVSPIFLEGICFVDRETARDLARAANIALERLGA